MSEIKHTPGPWEAIGSLVRTTPCANNRGGMDGGIMVAATDLSDPLRFENARLIAAAPELLHALIGLLETYGKPDEQICCSGFECGCLGATVWQEAEHYARAALAKAENG